MKAIADVMLFSRRFLSSLIFVLILFVNIKVSIANRDGCERPKHPLNQVYIYENKNNCYYAFNVNASRSETKKFCCKFGAHILWLESFEEDRFISHVMSELGNDNVWIGTKKHLDKTIWESCSNKTKPVNYENWEVKNPNRQRTFGRLNVKHAPVWISECLEQVSLPVICEKCKPGFFGDSCELGCGHCKDLSMCDPIDGTCLHGCEPGWLGDTCHKTCFMGFYGTDCKLECGHCKNSRTCDSENGFCLEGCEEGWAGHKCNIKTCPDQFYGENCKHRCGNCKGGLTCNYQTGICENGCEMQWKGEKCQQQVFAEGSSVINGHSLYTVHGMEDKYKETFLVAQKRCCEKNAHLLWLESGNEENFILINIMKKMSLSSSWLGTETYNCVYKWISCNDKKGMTYQNWNVSSHAKNASHIAVKLMDSQKTAWVTIHSDIELSYICEQCVDGFYGDGCQLECNHCLNSVCDAITGYCHYGCIPGYYGRKCDINEDQGFIFNYGSSLYRAFGRYNRKNFNEAQLECCHHGYHLLWLESKEEEDYIKEHILSAINSDFVWLGTMKKDNKYSWLSCSNETVDLIKQIPSPKTNCFQGDHVYLDRFKSQWLNAYGLQFYMPFICEGCKHGMYGSHCAFHCGKCANNSQCDATTGICSQGCDIGWQGLKCDTFVNNNNNMNKNIPMNPNNERIQMDPSHGKIQMDAINANAYYGNKYFPSHRRGPVHHFPENYLPSGNRISAYEIQKSYVNNYLPSGSAQRRGSFSDFIGCFQDQANRAMNSLFATSKLMTVEWCKEHCRKNGYIYAALQYENQCFCGNGGYDKYGISTQCNEPCSGDPSIMCGGTWANSVYKSGDFLGCFIDSPDRAMSGLFASFNSMTVGWCKLHCHDNGYMYAALQSGSQCFCGDGGYDKYGKSNNCNNYCAGNSYEICGGTWTNSVYKVGDSIGCFIDRIDRAMDGLFASSHTMTVEWCKRYCRKNGYIYAALQNGNQCFCGNGGYDKYGITNSCNMHCSGNMEEKCGGHWANSVYKVGDSIGCFVDKADRAMSGLFATTYSMTIDWCKRHCRENGYIYAAAQYGNQCFCGNGGYDKYGISENCDKHCADNPYETCGGNWASSVYKVGDSIGCFVDKADRALRGLFISSFSMTIDWCKGHCRDKGYTYAALQNGNQCFCGNGGYDKYGITDNCNKHCTGNPNAVCGGSWANSVYKVGNSIGCFVDKAERALTGLFVSSDSMTIEWCKGHCRRNQYMYAALQNGNQCFCGNGEYDKYGISENCNKQCTGNPGTVCGGSWANSVHKVGDFIGCFVDKADRALNGLFVSFNSMTIDLCKEHCHDNEYMYAALQNGDQCHCGNGDYAKYGRSDNCNTNCKGNAGETCGGYWANSVYKVGDSIGCFVDNAERALTGLFVSLDSMTIEWCKGHCHDKRFMYAALQNGNQCFCGNSGYDRYGKSGNCNKPCNGKRDTMCGGIWSNSVYKVGGHAYYVDNSWSNKERLRINYFSDSVGCFKDKPNRAMNKISISADIMTIEWCKEHCRDNGYIYAALQHGDQCFCGNYGYNKYGRSDDCRMPCGGNRNEICGGNWAISVYKVAEAAYQVNSFLANDDLFGTHEFSEAGKIDFSSNGSDNLTEEEIDLEKPVESNLPEKPVESNLPGYVGCYSDKNLIMKSIGVFKNLTIPFCMDKAQEQGYKYAGLQNGSECFGGAGSFGTEQSRTCNKRCGGNKQTVCGGYKSRSVYSVEGYVGCYKDHANRTLTKEVQGISNMTISKCKTECRKMGYKYAGTQFGSKCFCGDGGYDAYGKSNECKKPCIGNIKEICGGDTTNSVYKVGDYIGCFKFNENQTYLTKLQTDTMTVILCKKTCQMTGNIYAGLYNASQCLCINQLADSNEESSDCDAKCTGNNLTICGGQNSLSFYQIGGYIGCFKDKKARSLQFEKLSDKMTVKMCQDLCSAKGFKYAGLEHKNECYCGNDGYDKYGTSKNCTLNFDATGKECGGDWAISVYLARDSPL